MSCALSVVLLVCLVSLGGVSSEHGKDFLITFQENELKNSRAPESQCITLTTTQKTNIAVQVTSLYPDINFNTSVVINNTISEYICLDNSIQLKGTGFSRKVVKVSADNDISVMVHDLEHASADSYIAIPIDNYGTEYYIVNYWDESQFSVTGTENDTVVTIAFPLKGNTSLNFEVNIDGITLINPSQIVLTIHEYDVYQLDMTHDLTGVFVSSNKPVAVISGNRKIFIYSDGATDHLAEQMPPVDTWGTHFTSVPSPSKTKNDIYTILASAPCTSVNVGNKTFFLEKKGEWIRIELSSTDPLKIVSDKPILVVKHLTRNVDLHQCMMLVVPRRQWLNQYTFHFPQISNHEGYLIIVVETQYRESILINDGPLNVTQWIEVENANISVGHIFLPNALYTLYLQETGGNFAAYIQHSNKKFAYCTSIGMKLHKINMGWQDNTCDQMQTTDTTFESTFESTSENTPFDLTTSALPTSSSSEMSPSTGWSTNMTLETEIISTSTEMTSTGWSPNKTENTYKTCFSPNPRLKNLSVTDEEFLNIIEELKQHLKVVPQKTSQAIRKKISVPDYRPSSTTIGMSWWIILAVGFVLCILGSDLLKIVKDCRYGLE